MGGETITKRKIVLMLISILLVTIILPISASAADSGVNIFRPTGNILVEWGPGTGSGYTQVDDVTPDETSSYIGTSIDGNKDVYSITIQPVSGIKNVTVYGRFITDFGNSRFNLILYKKSTTAYNYSIPIQLSRSGSWETISYTWETNPFTESNWTESDIDDLGIGICADYCARGNAIFCTQVYMEAAYFIPDTPPDDETPPDDDTNSSDEEDLTIEQLIEQVMLLNLPKRLERRLISKLKRAIKFRDKGRVRLVINRLKAFIRQVKRLQRRDKLTEEEENLLTGNTQQIIDNLRDEIDNHKIKVGFAKAVKRLARRYLKNR